MDVNEYLNGYLARKLMGWTNVGYHQGGNVLFGYPDDDYNRDYPTNKHREQVPDFANSIAQCFEYVIPAMRDRGYYCELRSPFTMDANEYYCFFDIQGRDDSVQRWKFYDPNPATAICEAARKALEVE